MDQLLGSLLIGRHYTPMAIDLIILMVGVALLVSAVARLLSRPRSASGIPIGPVAPQAVGGPSLPVQPGQPVASASSGSAPDWPNADENFFGSTTVLPSTSVAPPLGPPAANPGSFTRWTPPSEPARRAAPASPNGRGVVGSVALIVVGTLITFVGLVAFVPDAADAMSSHTVSLPSQTAHLVQIPLPAAAQQAAEQIKAELPAMQVSNVQFGLYAKPGTQTPEAVAVVAQVAGTPNIGAEFDDATNGLPASMVKVSDAGMPGQMRCGTLPAGTRAVNSCVWLDDDTVGILVVMDTGLTTETMTELGVEFRAATEH